MLRCAAILCLALVPTAALQAETPAGAAEKLDAWLDRFPDLGPGFAVVVVSADEVLLNRTTGSRRAATGAALTSDTPMYIASQTKAYLGLLAATLDERGVLPLDSTLADHWPALKLPGGLDPDAYTMRDLLTHQVPVRADFIVTLEAYAMHVAAEDYPRLLAEHGEAREAGYEYDNIGYNVYAAILETATGKPWQSWLEEVLFEPLGLTHTSARTTDFDEDELSWGHIWQGEERGWHAYPPKTDGMMQSAGGMFTSPGDMARWLQIQLRGDADVDGIDAGTIRTAHESYAATGMEDRRNPYELACSGYSLGWNLCDYKGHTVYIHGGGYTGMRSMMAFAPTLEVGIAAFSNSDNMTGWLTSRTLTMYLQFLTDDEEAEAYADLRVERYAERVEQLLERRTARLEEMEADPGWGGWEWEPQETELREYEGAWSTDEPYLDVDVRMEDGQLVLRWGDSRRVLRPATPGLFGAQTAPYEAIEAVEFERNEAGEISALVWQERQYARNRR